MKLNFFVKVGFYTGVFLFLGGCLKDTTYSNSQSNYPDEMSIVIGLTCSTTGCHTSQSKQAAGGISMSTWDELMQGGNNYNASVVPYAPDQSPLLYIINSYDEFGPTLAPRMPFAQDAFTKEEVLKFYNWILAGAPNAAGEVMFSDDVNRSIIYVLNAQCNKVALIDVASGLIMRYIDINAGGGGFAEVVEVAPNGGSVYVLHQSGILKKFNCLNHAKNGQVNLGDGFWRSMTISSDSKIGMVADWSGNSDLHGGQIALIDLDKMSILEVYDTPDDSIYFPFGITINTSNTQIYASCQTGNFIYKIDISDRDNPEINKVPIQTGEAPFFTASPYRPGQIVLSDSDGLYYVICEQSHEVRVFSSISDELLHVNTVGKNPQRLVICEKWNCYAVSCMEDQESFDKGKGSVIFFDQTTHSEIKRVYTGYQPKAMVLDQANDYLYILNRNADVFGADAPHHFSGCEGNNGYATRIELSTLTLSDDYKVELNVNPYAAAIRL